MISNKSCIGIFDSGVGGLTVLKQIKKLLPKENLIYFADNNNSPYGDKQTCEIEALCLKIANFLAKKNCKLIMIACNTATVASLESIKKTFPEIPVVGVIHSGAITAIASTQNLKIGVIATPLTIAMNGYQKELSQLSKNVTVAQVACKEFCTMIETGWTNNENRFILLEHYISLLPKDIDTLILGCTHYPIILEDIKKYFLGTIIDPAFGSSQEIVKILKEKNLLNPSHENGKIEFFVSGESDIFKTIGEKILNMNIQMVKKIYL